MSTDITFKRGSFLSVNPVSFHQISYLEWGEKGDLPPIICVHGLTRNGHDFDVIARKLAKAGRYVICPDMAGRGKSDFLPEGKFYNYPQYITDCTMLLAHLNIDKVQWVGTSMGGLIGMMMAAKENSPISDLVMNDIGAVIPANAMQRIADYVGLDLKFKDLAALQEYLRKAHADFGLLSEDDWHEMAVHGHYVGEGAKWLELSYDKAIGGAFKKGKLEDVDLSNIWEMVDVPTLILHGENSDFLTVEIISKMLDNKKENCHKLEFKNCGHAPYLNVAVQYLPVIKWLEDRA